MKRRCIELVVIVLFVWGCGPLSDCGYRYTYVGHVAFPYSLNYKEIKIGIEPLDRVVYNFDTIEIPRWCMNTKVDSFGIYHFDESFLGECPPKEIKRFQGDYLKYEIFYGDSLIQEGKFYANSLVRHYNKEQNCLTLDIPDLFIKEN